MAPTATIQEPEELQDTIKRLAALKPIGHSRGKHDVVTGFDKEWADKLPETTKQRFAKYGIDVSQGYPYAPVNEKIPKFVDEVYAIRKDEFPYVERGKNADPEKKLLFDAAEDVIHLTPYVGTEIVGLQLADLTDQQKDELALLIAERVVVFFKDQDLSPQKQLELGHYWGQVEVHPQATRIGPEFDGVTVIWQEHQRKRWGLPLTFKNSKLGNSQWHSDLVHEFQTAGITHLHLDAIPGIGGETLWSSTYGAYDKLSPALQQFLDGKTAIYRSAHQYLDRENPLKGPKYVEREHPIVRTHPATGWKYLFVNRSMTVRIVGLLPAESDLILNYLFEVIESNRDIQVRWSWQKELGSIKKKDEGAAEPKVYRGVSALWDNRVANHSVIHSEESIVGRHGTRVTSLADTGYFDPNSKSQREALGLSLD
ncbi:putative alpha-ketoglutarate-dependent sulfonate dioxygenase [Candida viswanathii]|uniref:Putative alpha-ketoglutarate-dependent sulfonate dioxygenase n=1 Tax=Candida viswanathii TaxID=5486 RepID=A0A367XWY3_9ASCO|nr:putative alpha-ketoglutarate-dependent sulfonate dioxygenase [Candida viswanathii]